MGGPARIFSVRKFRLTAERADPLAEEAGGNAAAFGAEARTVRSAAAGGATSAGTLRGLEDGRLFARDEGPPVKAKLGALLGRFHCL